MPIKLEGENRIYFKLDILTESEFHDPLSFSFINLSITLATYDKTAFKLKYPINNNLPDVSLTSVRVSDTTNTAIFKGINCLSVGIFIILS